MIEDSFRVEPADWIVDQADLKFVRTEVFILGQNIPEAEEWDDLDPRSAHVLARDNDGNPIGTGRLTPDDKIGRMAVLASWRGRHVGDAIMRALIERARQQHRPALEMHAQSYAIPFYQRFGFEPYGEEFVECDIPHRMMRLELAPLDTGYRPGMNLADTPAPRLIAVESREQAQAAVLELLGLAKREIAIYTRDLDPSLFDQEAVLDAIKRIATAGRGALIRVIVQAPAIPLADNHRLIGLAHRLPSVFQFRTPDTEQDLQYPSAFLITDSRGYFFRALGSRFDGEAHTYAPGRQAQLREFFNQVWERSLPPPQLRELHL
ncbi:putative GNAT family N-acyltransferase [Tahibacter aquaticus]|uniref:Putative GNAT family N-acyltransferase n=1 Tax=Tahibacter aquaticus TaxID=520092 RepID=A0A4R6YYX9_9GAMM|nr:GNAT family N-acetyltransferase [Tahibacter aquaticus]TDR44043.1 putative GNAT family N-acyltransferase [Tahibacter aquaticus]